MVGPCSQTCTDAGLLGWVKTAPRPGSCLLLRIPICHKGRYEDPPHVVSQNQRRSSVLRDLRGNATLKDASTIRFEFIEGQHPQEDKEALASEVSDLLGIECVWVRGPDWTESQH
jgi:hypothetical protein